MDWIIFTMVGFACGFLAGILVRPDRPSPLTLCVHCHKPLPHPPGYRCDMR
jgi:hypothetical protein